MTDTPTGRLEDDYLTYTDVENLLNISRDTLLRIIDRGELTTVDISKRSPRILRSSLEDYLIARTRP